MTNNFSSTMANNANRNRGEEAVRIANELFTQKPEWVTFFREILGVDGVVSQLFSSTEELESFKQTQQWEEIQNMLSTLRSESSTAKSEDKEPQRVITVRLPKSLHESLRAEAHTLRTSMNKLCISKLLLQIEETGEGEDASLSTESTNSTLGGENQRY